MTQLPDEHKTLAPLDEGAAIDQILNRFDPFNMSYNDFVMRMKPQAKQALQSLLREAERQARRDEVYEMLKRLNNVNGLQKRSADIIVKVSESRLAELEHDVSGYASNTAMYRFSNEDEAQDQGGEK